MQLHPLTLATGGLSDDAASPHPISRHAELPCSFCGVRSGHWQFGIRIGDMGDRRSDAGLRAACPLCVLATSLDRRTIDREAMLVWLPEMSQQVVNTLMREVHLHFHGAGLELRPGARPRHDTPTVRTMYHTRELLAARSQSARMRLGTSRPSELAVALRHLPVRAYGDRTLLLGGLRLLPTGEFHAGGADVYPQILGVWSAATWVHPEERTRDRAEAVRGGKRRC